MSEQKKLPMNEQNKLLKPDEMAAQLGVKLSWLLRMARQNKLPSIRLSPHVLRFDPVAVFAAVGN